VTPHNSKLPKLILAEAALCGKITVERVQTLGKSFHSNPERAKWILVDLRTKGLLRRIGPDEYALP
jgi:hypothetical protein